MAEYRIYRIDPKNIAIQRKRPSGKRWDSISYHGNSPSSLVTGLYNLIMAQHIPADEKLLKQLKKLELELVLGQGKIAELIKECT